VISTTALHAPSRDEERVEACLYGHEPSPGKAAAPVRDRRPQRTPSRTFVDVETINDFESLTRPVPAEAEAVDRSGVGVAYEDIVRRIETELRRGAIAERLRDRFAVSLLQLSGVF